MQFGSSTCVVGLSVAINGCGAGVGSSVKQTQSSTQHMVGADVGTGVGSGHSQSIHLHSKGSPAVHLHLVGTREDDCEPERTVGRYVSK